ncbi:ABC transporter permease subunit [Salinibacterium sp. ZJ454]|uniref:ABC transporter permease subunit n=1 Tax=Salinibacterium sp. ZJ454 TaxID=2708339 RepID=UPI001421EBC8|nr:ABC transporter permease subunit [Salinibacterium sp. ZJ454]
MIAWTLGIAAALLLYLPLFSSISSTDFQELIANLPEALVETIGYTSIGTGSGYVQSTFLGLMGFALFTIAAIAWGSAAVAGDEENGTLELTLAHSVSRSQVLLERWLALFARLLWLGVVSAALILLLNEPSSLDLEVGNVIAGTTMLVLLALSTGSIALAVGAITGRRTYATAAGAVVAVGGYAANAIANQVDELDWLYSASPYSWAFQFEPLVNGIDWICVSALVGLTAVAVTIGLAVFARRDVDG